MRDPDGCRVALAVAEALSLVYREVDAEVALARLRQFIGDDPAVLAAARDSCSERHDVEGPVATAATDLLATAAMLARSHTDPRAQPGA